MSQAKYAELQRAFDKIGIDLKTTSIMNAIKKFEKRVWQEAEDYYLSRSSLERVTRKLERWCNILEEQEKDGNT